MKRLTYLPVFLFSAPFLMIGTERIAFASGVIFSDFGPGNSFRTSRAVFLSGSSRFVGITQQ